MEILKEIEKPIIFIGTGRSGTTIISEIIMRHPDIAFPSNYQNKFYKSSSVNVIRLLFDNSIWRIFGQKKQINKVGLFNKFYFKPDENYLMWNYLTGTNVDFSRSFLLNETLEKERVDFIRNYFYKMVKFQRRKRLAFKITGPSRISFLKQIFPDAVFINLKRKKIPTINSFLKVGFWKSRGAHQLWWTGAYTEDEKAWAKLNADNAALLTAFQLRKIEDTTRIAVENLNPEYLEIYYEDFVANPGSAIDEIINFGKLNPYNLKKYLDTVQIHNRNKKDQEYFSEDDLKEIYKILDHEN